ncbi:efflux RND transporter permease subunit [Wenzhouxiangella marina]|uniref:RND family efflux transporter n=1 Tax=Wenzhouxiangella marina TaxID=1579979 RepID=A0A0K0XU90_9GAMM|nr:efflux RND transporter permease subunit [Wenzhouxiangella marina]AKS41225.1 RND family efflux transporter [Wenzhouxiangella marina]MBB6088105.1 hydrophobe/amphiphile efflux-1 (HAE1) family protein [Wenzhouxiangella marina]
MSDLKSGLPALGIRRPVMVMVMNLLIALAGLAALRGIEVRELPDVDRPIVGVSAQLPGASPETMDNEVTRILEGAVARVSGVQSIRASSEESSARIRVEFSPDADLDIAASDVREAVNRARRELPDEIEEIRVVKAEQDADPVISIAVLSDTHRSEALTRIIGTDIIPEINAIDGVADVPIFGDRQRELHVVIDPPRLARFGLSVADVANRLREARFDVPVGSFKSDDQQLLVRADASTLSPEAVLDTVIRGTTRIADVAQVYFGPADANSLVRLDGQPVVGFGVVRQASSNTIQISDEVRAVVERLNQRFADLELVVTSDDATFIRESVREVLITLALAIAIVIATLWLFTGSLRATLVPCVTIPVALVGTVAVIWLLGFSINLLTLLAIVLATGLVVDDAIVVLENIQRRRAQGLPARAAAVLGSRQVFFAVIATSITLVAVFVPIAFLPSTAGRLFREFGVVLAVAVAISSFVALSLVPTLTSRLPAEDRSSPARRALEALGRRLADAYGRLLERLLDRPWATVLLAVLLAASAAGLYRDLNQELIPTEDRGVLIVNASGPDGVGLAYSERQANRMEAILQPVVDGGEGDYLYSLIGRYDPNRNQITIPLVHWDERERSQQEIAASVLPELQRLPGVRVSISNPNSLSLRDAGDGLEMALLGNDYPRLFEISQTLAQRIEDEIPYLSGVRVGYQPTQPELSVVIDRRRAADLGVPLEGLAGTLRAMVDGDEIISLSVDDESIPIRLSSTAGSIDDPTDLVNLYVPTERGGLVPLSSLISLSEDSVAAELDRREQRRSIDIDANIAPGIALQTAVDDVRALAEEILPGDATLIMIGEAAELEKTSRDVGWTYFLALLIVFLVLAAQFESLTSALVVTLIVPFGVAAAILALFLTGVSINIYSQIGLVLLIGLMAKNSILLVEFADQLRDQGASVRNAIVDSARIRVRPIVMTLLSTVLGGLPLILSAGAGAEARASIGWVVFGGLSLAAVFTLFLTPVVYALLAPISKPRAHEADRLSRELEQAGDLIESA